MSIECIIDNRERKLITLIGDTISVTVEQLDLGDIVFRRDGKIILIIERKTLADLKASIYDRRYKEQKARLLNCGIDICRIMYIVEGSLNKTLESKVAGMPVSTLVSSLISTQLRDGIKVYKTSSLKETAEFIKKLKDKLEKDIDLYFKQNKSITDVEYASSLSTSKKKNMTPSVWFIKQLALLPQVTEKIGNCVSGLYPSVVTLVNAYSKVDEKVGKLLLANIKYEIKGGKQRRIGDVVSSRIWSYFNGI